MNMRTISTSGASTPAHVPSDDTHTDAPCYLLFAGAPHHPPFGGVGDLVGTFASEEAARRAFHHLRVQGLSEGAWAQLAVIDVRTGLRPVCWFGIGAAGRAPHVLGGSTDVGTATRKRRWMERYRGHAGRGRLLARRRRSLSFGSPTVVERLA